MRALPLGQAQQPNRPSRPPFRMSSTSPTPADGSGSSKRKAIDSWEDSSHVVERWGAGLANLPRGGSGSPSAEPVLPTVAWGTAGSAPTKKQLQRVGCRVRDRRIDAYGISGTDAERLWAVEGPSAVPPLVPLGFDL